jgi:hypothetical protein
MFEPSVRFKKAGQNNGFSEQALWIMKIGETKALLSNLPQHHAQQK